MSAVELGVHGGFECLLVSDGDLPAMPLSALLPTAEMLREEPGRGDELVVSPTNCLLLRSANVTALVDTGLSWRTGLLRGSLRNLGIAPEAIDLVVLTHCHPDHIGGLTVAGLPTFTRARHVIAQTEWAFWTDEAALAQLPQLMSAAARAQLPPLAESRLVEQVEGDVELMSGVRLLSAPGHTPGHYAVEIGGGGGLLYLADAVSHELHFAHLELAGFSDHDPGGAAASRQRLLEQAAEHGSLVAAFHLRGAGSVARLSGAFQWMPQAE